MPDNLTLILGSHLCAGVMPCANSQALHQTIFLMNLDLGEYELSQPDFNIRFYVRINAW